MRQQTVPVFVVSVERNREKAERLRALLNEYGVKAEVFWGVDGAFPISWGEGEAVDFELAKVHYYASVSPMAIGCFLSHYRLWRMARLRGYEQIAVMEDDTYPLPWMGEALEEIVESRIEFDMIDLVPREFRVSAMTGPQWKAWLASGALLSKNALLPAVRVSIGTHAYMMSRRGIDALLRDAMPITRPLDVTLRELTWSRVVSRHVVYPGVVGTDPFGGGNLIPAKFKLSAFVNSSLSPHKRYGLKWLANAVFRRGEMGRFYARRAQVARMRSEYERDTIQSFIDVDSS